MFYNVGFLQECNRFKKETKFNIYQKVFGFLLLTLKQMYLFFSHSN